MNLSEIRPFVRHAFLLNTPPADKNVCAFDGRIFYLLKGAGELWIDHAPYSLSPGSIAVIPPGVPYAWHGFDPADFSLLIVNFDYTMAHCHLTEPMPPAEEEQFDTGKIVERARFADAPCLEQTVYFKNMYRVQQRLLDIVDTFAQRQAYHVQVSSADLTAVLIEVLRACQYGMAAGGEKIAAVLSYINAHYAEDITNQRLGEVLNYHPYYANTLMKKHMGMTLHAYLVQFRISEAAKLLLYTRLPVSEIAFATGFKNETGFYLAFRKRMGMSPSEYRKKASFGNV